MRSQKAEHELIEECLNRIEQRRGNSFTTEQRQCAHEIVDTDLGKIALSSIWTNEPSERDKQVEGLIRMSLISSGETLPVPRAITLEVLNDTPDAELPQMLYDYLCDFLSRTGAYEDENYHSAILGLPIGLQTVFLLVALNGEVGNGGFHQFFTNSNGMFVDETLAACSLVRMEKHREILEAAFEVWTPAFERFDESEGCVEEERAAWSWFEAEIEPKLWELAQTYYELESIEPLPVLLTVYLRSHPEGCLMNPDGTAEKD